MHKFCRTDNRIGRTDLNAFGAADASLFDDVRDTQRLFDAVIGVLWDDFLTCDLSQFCNTRCTTWRTLIDGGIVKGNGVRVRRATIITTLGTLRLWQDIQYLLF